jgi:glyoxylase-like metal-dependent hydrolase (beta-lactamase superfamily II)
MSHPAPTQVAPGVHRLGDHSVNFYLVEDPDGVILIDTGLPAHRKQLLGLLAELGHDLAEVRAVLLTHGHLDHTGLAHALQQAGAQIWIHQQDAAILHDGPLRAYRHAKPERSMLPYLLRRPSALAMPIRMARAGGLTAPAVRTARTFDADQVLAELPGAPRAVALPGHTPGSTAYLFADRGLVFTGDALVTVDPFSGRTGPTLVSRCFTHDSRAALAALDRLDAYTADLVLPGHGAPFTEGTQAAIGQARRFGVH